VIGVYLIGETYKRRLVIRYVATGRTLAEARANEARHFWAGFVALTKGRLG